MPTLSVIIPVYNASRTLARCLESIQRSSRQPMECIVIDDGSTDGSAAIAERFRATVLSAGKRQGPAAARNLGARSAAGDTLVFVDADVAVHAGTLELFAVRFEQDPELDAAIGSYDDAPADGGIVSHFKNLMHHFVHQNGRAEASTFWCGCGAVKRHVYIEHGGLDESYRRPSIEDIEFGLRLFQAGRKLALCPEVQAKHLKIWTLGSLLKTDIFQRGIPWTELILRTRSLPDDLNLSWRQRISAVIAGLIAAFCVVGAVSLAASSARVPLQLWAASVATLLAVFIALNRRFYRFLAARVGWRSMLATIPLHFLYFLYSGISFIMGAGLYLLRGRASAGRLSRKTDSA